MTRIAWRRFVADVRRALGIAALAMLSMFLALPAAAQIGFGAGVGKSWLKLDDRTVALTPISLGLSYDAGILADESGETTGGITVGARGFRDEADPENETKTALIFELGWWQLAAESFHWMVLARYGLYPNEFLGEQTETLAGRAALLFYPWSDQTKALEFSTYIGTNVSGTHVTERGIYLGPRVLFGEVE